MIVKAVPVIAPALVYDMKGEVYALPADIFQTIDHFTVPNGYRRGFRERSRTCSLGVYVPLEGETTTTSISGWRTPRAAKTKKATAAT